MKSKINIVSLMLTAILLSANTFAQRVNVTTAYNNMRSEDYVEARSYIDKAIEDDRTKTEEKTWRYRGLIYNGLLESEDPQMERIDAVQEAMRSFKKALELDDRNRWEQENTQGYAIAQNHAMNLGIQAYNDQNYDLAKRYFLSADLAARDLGVVDTLAVYNAGLSAEQAEDYETALKQYGEALDMGYLGPQMYVYTANVYVKKEDPEGYIRIIRQGREAYPEDADLIVYELNHYLRTENFEEAKGNLELAIEKEPENKQLHFSLGVVHDNLGEFDEAQAAYQSALEIDPNYFDAVYNLGALHFNKGVEMNKAANDIQDNQAYAEEKERVKEVFLVALPYLEKAHELNPEDRNPIASLAQLYALIGENDKFMEMKALLDAGE